MIIVLPDRRGLYKEIDLFIFESPLPVRRRVFRDAKCVRTIFVYGGASNFGRVQV